ncbi:bifunctional D-glycero-beta-D-manno-heptose-7-phosphate kinase/D-glycero-beta-D-manno-heptose 1-phosphate adenylyltransferase HldE [Psittacicella hinzii]|uniref:Bifunctional protein HldE n=1 Tax=Psittacicella hinzii TaxID=2028575 RepID=A0A3A1YRK6_9GAMM|nr:bifunctional D-glycero-beta-D-manno-heptose-7-phosphate kinase/D-glycero-beta-D-manno-heptose 1-phosphate adenylyltransferase HldE [Psittacicella hinzii]RIY40295.1 hypothetical protein CKF58_00850 [Psittacicella hinzii]
MNTQPALDFNTAKVFVFGDVMIDHYWHGDTSRISPEAPVPVVLYKRSSQTLGGAANVAQNIKALGAHAVLSGLIGQDDNSLELLELCKNSNLENLLITIPNMQTTKKLRILSRHQQLLRIDFENSPAITYNVPQVFSQFANLLEQSIQQSQVVILSDYFKGARELFPFIIELANKYKKPVIIDPKGNDYSLYRHASLLTPNLSEFKQIAAQYGYSPEAIANQEQESQIANHIINDLDLYGILITKSENGMTLHLKDGRMYHQLTYAEDVYDVTGAGDTVIATLATALASGIDIIDACYYANKAAGISVSKLGTSTVSLLELQAACGYADSSLSKIEQAKKDNKKIVFTNGCFDILHRGHLTYLKRAKELGDILIVGINSDSSVKALKGDSRPINKLEDRMLMLESLKFVDFVIPFEQETPLELIKQIMPDILVKGGDYQVENIVGYAEVTANGGKVQTIPFIDDYSSTTIINKIKSK